MQIEDLLIEMEALSADDPRYLKKALQTLRLERCRLLENGHTIQKQLDDLDYVIFKVNQMVDDKTDFKKAAEKFIKENPRFTGSTYRVSTGSASSGSGGTENPNDSINAAIRRAAGRQV